MRGDKAQFVFTDPPYNVPIDGHVCGLGRIRHKDFAMGCGEMTPEQFTAFLAGVFEQLCLQSVDGAIHQVCMDWRHMREILTAGYASYAELKNVCVWNKTNAGMGSFYRSKHELVFVWKHGSAPHINNFELGQHGRTRSNVWDYDGVNTLRPGRLDELAMHPTVKPVALVVDAIRDCSKHGGIVLDPFCGSGTVLIAWPPGRDLRRHLRHAPGQRHLGRQRGRGCLNGQSGDADPSSENTSAGAGTASGLVPAVSRRDRIGVSVMCSDSVDPKAPTSGSESEPPRVPDYDVGHGRPPRHSRWAKGQSGNPKGRAKEEAIDLLASFKGMLDEAMTNRSDGRVMSKRELMVRALFQQAMQGNQRAFGRFLKLAKKAGLLKGLKLPWGQGGGTIYARSSPTVVTKGDAT
jgi:hypothetical protein